MTKIWDVVIVGARCSGAALGVHLARAGLGVLIVEASPRGTDMPMSTHFIQPPGVAALDRLGIGDQVRALAPATQRFRLTLDSVDVALRMPTPAVCVRRSVVDPLLQDAAERAGAELRDRHRVVDLLREGERVTGVVVETPSGREEIRARLVVGADGPNSTVAKLTRAAEYLGVDGDRGGFSLYYPAPERWEHSWDSLLEHRGDEIRYVFRSDGGLVLLVAVVANEQAATFGKDWRARTIELLRSSPSTAPFVEGKEPAARGAGLLKTRYFYREPVGPGYALVGDAGHFKDFVTGMGMTDAFEDAERLTRAVIDGRDTAFERFWRERDVETLPLHFDALGQGRIGFNSPFMRFAMSHVARRPDITERFARVFNRKMSPYDAIPMKAMLPWMAKALVKGRFDVIRGFLDFGKRAAEEQRENRRAPGAPRRREPPHGAAPRCVTVASRGLVVRPVFVQRRERDVYLVGQVGLVGIPRQIGPVHGRQQLR